MNTLPAWVAKIQAVWLALGTFLTILAFQGVPVPEWAPEFLNQATFDVIAQAVTALFTAYQVIRAIFVASPKPATLNTLSEERARRFAWNPFKLSA